MESQLSLTGSDSSTSVPPTKQGSSRAETTFDYAEGLEQFLNIAVAREELRPYAHLLAKQLARICHAHGTLAVGDIFLVFGDLLEGLARRERAAAEARRERRRGRKPS